MTTIVERMRAAADMLLAVEWQTNLRDQLRADADALEAVEQQLLAPKFIPTEKTLAYFASCIRGEVG